MRKIGGKCQIGKSGLELSPHCVQDLPKKKFLMLSERNIVNITKECSLPAINTAAFPL